MSDISPECHPAILYMGLPLLRLPSAIPKSTFFVVCSSPIVQIYPSVTSVTLQSAIPRYQLSTYDHWAFSVAGPTVWNSLPEDLRDPECCADSYRQSLKTFLFSQY